MPFADEAEQIMHQLPQGNPLRLTLEYLLACGKGRKNARPMGAVLGHLSANGVQLTGPRFQTTVLKQTRLGSIFIGSGPRGFFLIETPEDAIVMRDFYESRIKSEQQQLDHLRELADQIGWQI